VLFKKRVGKWTLGDPPTHIEKLDDFFEGANPLAHRRTPVVYVGALYFGAAASPVLPLIRDLQG
jgi:hypothetical protein